MVACAVTFVSLSFPAWVYFRLCGFSFDLTFDLWFAVFVVLACLFCGGF